MAVLPFPARAKLLQEQFHKKQFQVNCLCVKTGKKQSLGLGKFTCERDSLLAQQRRGLFWVNLLYIFAFLTFFLLLIAEIMQSASSLHKGKQTRSYARAHSPCLTTAI